MLTITTQQDERSGWTRVLMDGRDVGQGLGRDGRQACEALADKLREAPRKAWAVYHMFGVTD